MKYPCDGAIKRQPLLRWLLNFYCKIFSIDPDLIDGELSYEENRDILEKQVFGEELRLGYNHPRYKRRGGLRVVWK